MKTRLTLIILALLVVGLVAFNRWKKNQVIQSVEKDATETVLPKEEPASQSNNLRTTAADKTVERLDLSAGSPTQSPRPAQTETVPSVVTVPNPQPAADPNHKMQTQVEIDAGINPEAAAMIRQSVQDITDGKVIEARDQLNHVLDLKIPDSVREEVKKHLTKLADLWLFGKQVYPGDSLTESYKIQPGNKLALLAKKYKIPHEAIEKINGITNPERLQAGQVVKMIHGPFSAVVSKKAFTLDLYLQGTFVKQYKVGLGKPEHDTPTGKWRAISGGKLVKPTWTDPDSGRVYQGNDPDYPLGSRWIALEGLEGAAKGRTGFAIHGTKDPESIGTRASRGCIRLYNGDVVEVYDLMEAGISEVMVVE